MARKMDRYTERIIEEKDVKRPRLHIRRRCEIGMGVTFFSIQFVYGRYMTRLGRQLQEKKFRLHVNYATMHYARLLSTSTEEGANCWIN